MKVTKDSYSEKVTIATHLLLEQVPFEGLWLARIPLLKIEDWNLGDHARFPHLVTDKNMRRVYYEKSCVTALEIEEWVHGVKHLGLLNFSWVPDYHHTHINTIYVCQLLILV